MANRRAIAAPMPWAAPVTTATSPPSSRSAMGGRHQGRLAEVVRVGLDLAERRDDVVDAVGSGTEHPLVEPDRLALAGLLRDGQVHLVEPECLRERDRDR